MTDTISNIAPAACLWDACVPWDKTTNMAGFDSGIASANTWLTKAGNEHATGRASTQVLVRGASNCGFFTMRQITIRGATEQKDEVANHLLWLALDASHHGAKLGKRLVLESLAAAVRLADQSPFRFIVLDVAADASAHVRAMYIKMGFVELSKGSPRLRMKVSFARELVGRVCAAGSAPVTWLPTAASMSA